MTALFLVYGFSFLILGMAIAIYPKRGSSFALARSLWLLALFAILHGTNEWIDMFLLMQKPAELPVLKAVRMVLLPASFFFLLQFGAEVIVRTKERYRGLRWVPLALLAVYVWTAWASHPRFLLADIWSRYLLCIPGTLLTAWALLLQVCLFENTSHAHVIRHIRAAAGAFLFYGIFSGWIVPPDGVLFSSTLNYTTFGDAVGVPVQVFRALCALVITYCTIRMLSIFDWETKEELRRARDDLEVRVKERTSELEKANAALVTEVTARKQAEEEIKESEARYRDLFENANDLIQSVDSEGRYLYVNRTWLKTLGYSREEVRHLKFMDVLHPSELPHCMEIFQRIKDGQEIDRMEAIFVSKQGQEVHVEGNINAQFDQGKFIATRGIFRNITQRREAETLIKGILESVGEGFVVIDPDFRIVSANWAYCNQVKRPLEEMIGRHCYEISHRSHAPCYLAGEECTVQRTFETGEPGTAIHTHWDKKGNPIYVELNSYPMKDRSGRTVAVIENVRDITEKRKLQQQLRQSQKMEAVGQLAGGIAHDFNNILTAVIGYAGLLQMDLDKDDPGREHAEEILNAAHKAAQLAQSLLAFSRKQIMHLRAEDLNTIVRNIEKLLSRIIGEDIRLRLELSDAQMTVMADSGQIEQVLMNLGANARDAMPEGGHLTIRTGLHDVDHRFAAEHGYEMTGTHARISVTDTGEGMDQAALAKIFDPFFTTKETGKGTGLGLSIAYGIIKQHKGFMNVTSMPGQGSTFDIYLPRVDRKPEKTRTQDIAAPMTGTGTVLLGEDNEGVRNLLKKVLEDAGYRVLVAVDGPDVIEIFKENRDDVEMLILDVVMPGKHGKAVHETIRTLRPDIKTLFISGYTADIIHEKGVLDTSLDFLPKPVHPGDLLMKVKEIMGRRVGS